MAKNWKNSGIRMQPTPPTIDITALTIEQLKALAYDQLQEMARIQANINLLQAEIARRTAPLPQERATA